ncbi:hypothetical protein CAter282_0013 [Collimonas arenae]|uniref:Uncharacterized protein n=1 Tax=Collimonas arenae TaxID=279058 RepID=A0A127PJI0_9BURK|nr:hypothetical protein CAter10_0014 [Collimonas arenae]AMP07838.1 hypothetical protein CAter282_0013 [Collimonas arenae]
MPLPYPNSDCRGNQSMKNGGDDCVFFAAITAIFIAAAAYTACEITSLPLP